MTAELVEPADLLSTAGRVEAEDDGDSRWYTHPETGAAYLSVTYVTGSCQGKPWLTRWSASIAARYAVDFRQNWQATLRTDGRDAAVKQITGEATANRNLKRDVGTYEHDVVEALTLDMPLPGIPESLDGRLVDIDGTPTVIDQQWLDGIADGYLNFVADFDYRAYAAECTVASNGHEAAGTIDGIGRLRGLTGLSGIDVKTGAHLGPEILAQLGAYNTFDSLWLRGGTIVPAPRVERWAILHVRPEYSRGYKLIMIKPEHLDVGWDWWVTCRAQLTAQALVPNRYGTVTYPPLPDGTQPPPMVEDLRWHPGCSRAIKPLVAAGWQQMADVALCTRQDLLALAGVGPKTVDALERLLDSYGIQLADREVA